MSALARTTFTRMIIGMEEKRNVVRFRRSGVDVIWDGSYETILEAAEANGVDIPYSCRCGLDTVCQTPLLSGSVSYVTEPCVDVPEGACLVCIAKPDSDIELDA